MIGSCRNVVAIAALSLTACSSNPVADHYYSLVLAADDVMATDNAAVATARLIVGPVQLPEYLDKRGLIIQIDSSQLQTANHHFWAEPLEEAISKVLVRDTAHLMKYPGHV